MQKLTSIAVVTCWFGEFPWYFSLFVKSCEFNPSIDFIIITNNDFNEIKVPENLKFFSKSIKEIEKIATGKLGFKAQITHPFKLNDFKPLYGFLFPEILSDYDFWGYADIDIVYGNIRKFLTETILKKHDVVTCRHDYTVGAFTLLKNNHKINTLFKQSRDYKKVLSSPKNFCFDECNYLFNQLTKGHSILDFPDNIQSMTYVVKKAQLEKKIKAFFDFIIIEGVPGKILWENGKITYKKLYECMFYHLIKFKKNYNRLRMPSSIPDKFYFTPTRILFNKK